MMTGPVAMPRVWVLLHQELVKRQLEYIVYHLPGSLFELGSVFQPLKIRQRRLIINDSATPDSKQHYYIYASRFCLFNTQSKNQLTISAKSVYIIETALY